MVGMVDGKTVVPDAPREEGEAVLKMPDGSEIKLPVLLDSAGAQFVDIRKLQSSYVSCQNLDLVFSFRRYAYGLGLRGAAASVP